jgi:hypothetical protein
MLTDAWAQRLDRHEAFAECRLVDRPVINPWRSGYYPAEQFPCGVARWRPGVILQPDEVTFAPFAEDYEQLYQRQHENHEADGYLGSAYWGIPWLEAIMGCSVAVAAANCCARPCLTSLDDFREISVDLDNNAWFQVLLRFTQQLVNFSAGRFPVCPPLLRGPGDTVAAMLGEMTYVTSFFDAPETMQALLHICARTRLTVIHRLQACLSSWQGVYAAGGYPSMVWSRRSVAYHQEDSAAILNPSIFRTYLLPALQIGCQAADVNFIHLHSACLYPVDILLDDRSFDILQINVDHRGTGPPVSQLIGTFQKIQAAGRPLLLWGAFSPEEWQLIQGELSPVGLSVQPIVSTNETPRWCT